MFKQKILNVNKIFYAFIEKNSNVSRETLQNIIYKETKCLI